MAAGVYITAVSDRRLEGLLVSVKTIHLPLFLSLTHTLSFPSLSLSYTRSLAVIFCEVKPPRCFSDNPQPLGSVCAQRGADNPGQDNRNRPPFVLASMGPMTVTVNSGHRLRPDWVSSTEGPLTRRTKAETQNKRCLNLPSTTHTDKYLSLSIVMSICCLRFTSLLTYLDNQ